MTTESIKFIYNSHDEVIKEFTISADALQHSHVVKAFFDFLENAYEYEIRSQYLKDED
jgi:hypothetical protein